MCRSARFEDKSSIRGGFCQIMVHASSEDIWHASIVLVMGNHPSFTDAQRLFLPDRCVSRSTIALHIFIRRIELRSFPQYLGPREHLTSRATISSLANVNPDC